MNKAIVIVIILLTEKCMAQDKDVASINYNISRLKYNDTSATTRHLEVKIRFPLMHKKNNSIIGAVNYKNIVLNHFPDSYINPVYGISAQAIWLKKLSEKNTLALFSQAGLFSDMDDISGKDFRYSVGARYRTKHSEKLSTGWGLVYSKQFFGNQIIPFIDIDYRPNDKWSITGQFPVKPKIMYHFSKKTSAGLELAGDGSSFRLSEKKNQNRFIQINQWAVLGKIEHRIGKLFLFNIGVGGNLRQTYKLFSDASSTNWTIITIPLNTKEYPLRKIQGRGIDFQAGISVNPFGK